MNGWRVFYNTHGPGAELTPVCVDAGPGTPRLWFASITIETPATSKFGQHPTMWFETSGQLSCKDGNARINAVVA